MPMFCCIVKCGSRSERDNVNFFRIPTCKQFKHEAKVHLNNLSYQRHQEWLKVIKRDDLTPLKVKNARVCSKHFISGKPSDLEDINNPDWKPNLLLGYYTGTSSPLTRENRYKRFKRRLEVRIDEIPSDMVSSAVDVEDAPGTSLGTSSNDQEVQTELRMSDLNNSFLLSSTSLKKENILSKKVLSFDRLKHDDFHTRYYTGFPNFKLLQVILDVFVPEISCHHNTVLSSEDQIILSLVKLRLNLDFKDLAFRFGISATTASTYFKNCIGIMRVKLSSLVKWPDRSILKKTLPKCFTTHHNNTTVIIDCFEIKIQKAFDLLASAETWSHYKHHHTIKYLIGITPQGTVCFISEGYGGGSSDTFITENSDFLNYLEPGDVVMADRGFLIKEYVELFKATLKTPAFCRGRSQLHPIELEETRELARVRIHIERVIGIMRQKYRIVNNILPISLLKTGDEAIIDEIVFVCCALVNLCPPIIPLS